MPFIVLEEERLMQICLYVHLSNTMYKIKNCDYQNNNNNC